MEQGSCNDRTMSSHLTGQCKSNDRTIGPQRPHVWASTTARFSCNGHYSFWAYSLGIAGYLLELMIEMGETVVAAVVCHLADIDVFVDQQFGCV